MPTALVTGNHDLEGTEFETDEANLAAWTEVSLLRIREDPHCQTHLAVMKGLCDYSALHFPGLNHNDDANTPNSSYSALAVLLAFCNIAHRYFSKADDCSSE